MQWERSKTQWMGAPVQLQSPKPQQHQPPRLEAGVPLSQQTPVAAEVAKLPGLPDTKQAGAGAAGILLFGDFKQQEVASFGSRAEPKPKQVTVGRLDGTKRRAACHCSSLWATARCVIEPSVSYAWPVGLPGMCADF